MSGWWRYLVLLGVIFGSLVGIWSLGPVAQDPAYHHFADRRPLFGVPNFADVISSLPFLVIGLAGIRLCRTSVMGPLYTAWLTLFVGVALVGFGSAWYHLDPDNGSLLWDRLPMTLGFMGLLAALLGEFVHPALGRWLLLPGVLLGLFSVVYWYLWEDLRLYVWVQLLPLLLIPLTRLFHSDSPRPGWLLVALGGYLLAKGAELYDRQIFMMTGQLFSGHTLKHLLAALACVALLIMLAARRHQGKRR